MVHRLRLAVAALGAFAFLAATGSPALATNKCASAKIKAAGKKAACKLSLRGKNASSGDPIDPLKEQKCVDKFNSAFTKAEAKPPCTTNGDATAIENKVDAFVADVNSELNVGAPNSCQGSKLKAAGKKAKCLSGLHAKQAAKGGPIDPLKIQKCIDKFNGAFSKAEGKGGCSTTGDNTAIENKVDAFVDDVDAEIPADVPTTTTATALNSSVSSPSRSVSTLKARWNWPSCCG